jgi:hypothetical protein
VEYNLEDAYGLKSLVENLFGNRAWLDIKHATDVKTWTKYSTRILSAIEFSAKVTVEIADDEWFKELNSVIEHGKARIKLAKSTEQIFAALSASLANISFLQLGRVPTAVRGERVTLRHQGNWKLNQFRSVQYVQSKEQAAAKEAHNKAIQQGRAKKRRAC